MDDALRLELRPIGVYVSVVEPGAIRTRMMEDQQPTVDAARAELDDEGHHLYGKTMEAVIHAFEEMKKTAIPAERVALAISRALRGRRPRARYVVGADVTLQIWLRWLLGDRLFDGLLGKLLKLPPPRLG